MQKGKYIRTPKIKEKNRLTMLGKRNAVGCKRTEDHKEKIRRAHLGKLGMAGSKNPNFGKKGERHPRWKGGRRNYLSCIANSVYRKFNINVICEKCGLFQNIHIHHKDEDRKNNNISNLQALCRSCHISLHSKARRKNVALT